MWQSTLNCFCFCRRCCSSTAAELKARMMSEYRHQLELYSLSRHHQMGDDVLREVLGGIGPK
ncbi:hypothetical protein EMIT0P258_20208 [Pseudomonas sp. IT-P258]